MYPRTEFLTLLTLFALACAGLALASDFEITRHTMGGGGVVRSTGGDFEISATIGQSTSGVVGGGWFQLTGGFWFPLANDDCNNDGLVDLHDYADFANCLSGPLAGLALPDCYCFDLDGDDDVDLVDWTRMQAALVNDG